MKDRVFRGFYSAIESSPQILLFRFERQVNKSCVSRRTALANLSFRLLVVLFLQIILSVHAAAQYENWRYSGSFAILTTPHGANLPPSASAENFPLLVRLDKNWFDFQQTKPNGADIRFTTSDGSNLFYEIDEWNASLGKASIWVRIPKITGNAHQGIKMYWGNPSAQSESNGSAVFNQSNGYVGVWHMNDLVKDETGNTTTRDTGTTPAAGMIGKSRHFDNGKGINGGEKNLGYPSGSEPHTSEAWFRPEKPNAIVMAWGNEARQGKVTMRYSSPPHVNMECYFSGADVSGSSSLSPDKWVHVVHTYQNGESRIYVNGVLDGVSATQNSPLNIKTPARLYIGGWYDDYRFVGDIDEVRVSRVTRSADWVRLEYENQKPLQSLVGPLIQSGSEFSVSEKQIDLMEGKTISLTAKAGGAQKVYWIMKRGADESIVAIDKFAYTLDAGRVTGDSSYTLRFAAVYPSEFKTIDIPVKIREDIPDPMFSLKGPKNWNGRRTIEVLTQVTNLSAVNSKGAGDIKTEWNAGPFAVIKEVAPGKLILKRALNSGNLTVTATMHNGGQTVTHKLNIAVTEPETDPWISRTPDKNEQPEDGQFYARDAKNEGTLYYIGKVNDKPNAVFLKVCADDKPFQLLRSKPAVDGSFSFSVKLKPGLIKYRVEFGSVSAGKETILRKVSDIVCGDAYLIDGQSNALATDTREKSPPETNEWIRSYGRAPERPETNLENLWCRPVWKAEHGEKAELGWWGMDLAKRLLESQKVPIFMINAAVGGTRIDQHQRNTADPTDLSTIYGRMLWRLRKAKLTHSIKSILWHQGENDQGSDGPTGGYGWETYQPFFMEMAARWKQDFPNLKYYYVFQIWPNSCSMGGRNGSGDRLREKQRTLPLLFSNMSIMSTLGIQPEGGCHFPLAGWSEFARLIQPLIERDNFGKLPTESVTPPNLKRAYYSDGRRDKISLEFDQPVIWSNNLSGQFYLDGEKDKVVACSVLGNVLTLNLSAPTTAKSITYLKEINWSQKTLLVGANGIAALTFCDVPIDKNPRE